MNCIGEIQERCSALFADEVRTIGIVHALEHDELTRIQADPAIPGEQKAQIREAAELESVHLADYRTQVLVGQLASLGCGLNSEQVKENLITRITGN